MSVEMNDKALLLHSRQMLLPAIGVEQQSVLQNSTVMIVGAGGLGCGVAQALVGSGVGRLILVDGDVVELANLPRQVLFAESDIGKPKAVIAAERLASRFEGVTVVAETQWFDGVLCQQYMPDIMVDAGDNLVLSQLIDCVTETMRLPLVHASVSRFEGHCYVCLPQPNFPRLAAVFPQSAEGESCSQTGVMTTAVALLSAYQATQVVRVLLAPCLGTIKPELMLFDGVVMRFNALSLGRL